MDFVESRRVTNGRVASNKRREWMAIRIEILAAAPPRLNLPRDIASEATLFAGTFYE